MPGRVRVFRLMASLSALILCSLGVTAQATECTGLAQLKLAHATVTGADSVPAGTILELAEKVPPAKTDFCRVQVTSKPSADSDIRLEVWVPAGAAWNGKFEQVGNGGFAGDLPYAHMARVLALGYAVAGTDDGHQSKSGIDASWALHHPEKIKDYGWRAISETTVLSRQILRRLTARSPAKSYFVGCSDGGREALMMAQRFPAYFDGIVAGAPAYAMTRLLTGGALRGQALAGNVMHLTQVQLALLQDQALKSCGNGSTYLADPRQCRVDRSALKCAGGDTASCLTQAQIDAVQLLYADQKDPATGATLYGVLPGAEAVEGSWGTWLTGSEGQPGAGLGFTWNYLAFMVMNDPKLDLAKVTAADLARGEREFEPVMDSNSADLSAFRKHGGKLIQYHGWNDPGIAPGYSLEYRQRLVDKAGAVDDFYRLYMVPGMLHCGGGDAPTQVNWQAALESWVEKAAPPGTLVAGDGKGATQKLAPFD